MPLQTTNKKYIYLRKVGKHKYQKSDHGKYKLSEKSYNNIKVMHEKLGIKMNGDLLILNQFKENLIKVIARIDSLLDKSRLVIKIDGKAASGKTSLSKDLSLIYDLNVIHLDDFFKKPEIDMKNPYSIFGSNIDFKKINDTVISKYQKRDRITYRPFDFKTHSHKGEVILLDKNLILFEGAYSVHPSLNIKHDLAIFYDVSRIKQIRRIYKRNGFKKLRIFLSKWIKNENKYHKALKIKKHSDLIIKS